MQSVKYYFLGIIRKQKKKKKKKKKKKNEKKRNEQNIVLNFSPSVQSVKLCEWLHATDKLLKARLSVPS